MVEELDIVQVFKKYRGVVKFLTQEGWIDPVKIRDMEIFLEYKKMLEEGQAKMKIYYKIAIRRNISVPTVRNAISAFK